MAEITIKDFKGVNLKEGLWDQGFSGYASGVDIYGLGDDFTKVSIEGVIQPALQLSAMPNAGVLTSVINDFVYYPNTQHVYGIDSGSNANIYYWDQATPQWKVKHTTVSAGRNLAVYNNTIYFTTVTPGGTDGTANAVLNSSDGTTMTTRVQTGLIVSEPMPMKIYSGYLFIANGRYVDRYDGSSYQSQKLVLPIDFIIRSMEVFRDGLYISADNGYFSRIFIWDGSSPTYTDYVPFPQEQFAPTLQAAQGFLWIIGNRGTNANGANSQTTFLTPIYIIQYGAPELLFELPIYRGTAFSPSYGTAAYQNGVLIASGFDAVVTNEDYTGGIWYIGKDLSTGLFHAVQLFPIFNKVEVGAIFSSGVTQDANIPNTPVMYVAYNDYAIGRTGIQIGQAGSSSKITNPVGGSFVIWQSLPIDAGSTKRKSWTYIKINMDQMITGQSIQIQYQKDGSDSLTILKTFSATTNATDRFLQIPIGITSRTITIRLVIGLTPPLAVPRIHSFTLYYEPTGE